MMKTIKYLSILILVILCLISGCSKLQKELPEPTSPTILHSSGWNDTSKANFHGSYLKAKSWKRNDCIQCHSKNSEGGVSKVSCFSCHSLYPHRDDWVNVNSNSFHGTVLKDSSWQLGACRTCHGTDLNGGISGISCTTCHSLYPHISGWTDESNPQYHGVFLKTNGWNSSLCKSCHGANLDGGSSGVSCYNCHESYPHLTGWVDEENSKFHGRFLETLGWDLSTCQACHGANLDGGTSGVSCTNCHESFPHIAGWAESASSGFHGKYLKSNNWDLTSCTTCHGSNYDGGTILDVSCMTSQCHVDLNSVKKSPEACNTCHGSFTAVAAAINSWAPPKSVDGETATTVRGVGAHQKHLATGTIGKSVKCQECHDVPSQTFASGHLETNLPAEVVFNDTLAKLITGNGTLVPNPNLNISNVKCDNVYCHGAWKLRKTSSTNQFAYSDSIMVGVNYSPLWTGGLSEAVCGSCHGLPPAGHIAATLTTCGNCHTGIVDGSGVIIDKTRHINGKINIFGSEKPMN
jgi:predicted CxxxxCH...CXXCH cytochrome family protein